jgi:hypothetical protein
VFKAEMRRQSGMPSWRLEVWVAHTRRLLAREVYTGASWIVTTTQRERDCRAGSWRRAPRALDGHESVLRRALLTCWKGHRWLPGDPSHLLDTPHGYEMGRRAFDDGQIRPARLGANVVPFGLANHVRRVFHTIAHGLG